MPELMLANSPFLAPSARLFATLVVLALALDSTRCEAGVGGGQGGAHADRHALEFSQPQSALEEGRARSLESKTKATLQFVNLTAKELKLFWLDFQGKRHAYGSIPAGGKVTHATFLTHRWLVTTPHGHGLAIFNPQGTNSTVLIDPMAAPKLGADAVHLRSTHGGGPTTLRFVNPTDQPVNLYWIDYQGRRQKRGSVAPRSELSQPTYAYHAWLVANADGKAEAVFVARPSAQSAVIAPDALDAP